MYMQVRNGLPGVVALIYNEPVTVFKFQLFFESRNFFKYSFKAFGVVFAHFRQQLEMRFWYSQKMIFSLRIYISYNDKIFVFVNFVYGNFAFGEFTKQTIAYIFYSFCRQLTAVYFRIILTI